MIFNRLRKEISEGSGVECPMICSCVSCFQLGRGSKNVPTYLQKCIQYSTFVQPGHKKCTPKRFAMDGTVRDALPQSQVAEAPPQGTSSMSQVTSQGRPHFHVSGTVRGRQESPDPSLERTMVLSKALLSHKSQVTSHKAGHPSPPLTSTCRQNGRLPGAPQSPTPILGQHHAHILAASFPSSPLSVSTRVPLY